MHCSASGADCRPKVVESSSVGHLRLIYSPFGEFKRAAGISYPATLWLPFILCRYRIYFTWHLIRRSQSPGSVDVGRWAESRRRYSLNLFKTKGRPIYPRINWSTINYSNVLFFALSSAFRFEFPRYRAGARSGGSNIKCYFSCGQRGCADMFCEESRPI